MVEVQYVLCGHRVKLPTEKRFFDGYGVLIYPKITHCQICAKERDEKATQGTGDDPGVQYDNSRMARGTGGKI